MHFAHGYLGASFFSPLANQRTDAYGGNLESRLRFHREALDAVRAVWPERLPLTMRLGSDDFNENGVQFDDAVWAVGQLNQHGLDLADLSVGLNTDDIKDAPFNKVAFMVGACVMKPLSGLLVVAFEQAVAAPYCTSIKFMRGLRLSSAAPDLDEIGRGRNDTVLSEAGMAPQGLPWSDSRTYHTLDQERYPHSLRLSIVNFSPIVWRCRAPGPEEYGRRRGAGIPCRARIPAPQKDFW